MEGGSPSQLSMLEMPSTPLRRRFVKLLLAASVATQSMMPNAGIRRESSTAYRDFLEPLDNGDFLEEPPVTNAMSAAVAEWGFQILEGLLLLLVLSDAIRLTLPRTSPRSTRKTCPFYS